MHASSNKHIVPFCLKQSSVAPARHNSSSCYPNYHEECAAYLNRKFNSKTISKESVPSNCPVHAKDFNKLEESYWAQWKPSKSGATKTTSLTPGSHEVIPAGTVPFPYIKMGKYGPCRNCQRLYKKRQCYCCEKYDLTSSSSEYSELCSPCGGFDTLSNCKCECNCMMSSREDETTTEVGYSEVGMTRDETSVFAANEATMYDSKVQQEAETDDKELSPKKKADKSVCCKSNITECECEMKPLYVNKSCIANSSGKSVTRESCLESLDDTLGGCRTVRFDNVVCTCEFGSLSHGDNTPSNASSLNAQKSPPLSISTNSNSLNDECECSLFLEQSKDDSSTASCKAHTQELVKHMKRLSEYIPDEARLLVKQMASIINTESLQEIRRQADLIVESALEQRFSKQQQQLQLENENTMAEIALRDTSQPFDALQESVNSPPTNDNISLVGTKSNSDLIPNSTLPELSTPTVSFPEELTGDDELEETKELAEQLLLEIEQQAMLETTPESKPPEVVVQHLLLPPSSQPRIVDLPKDDSLPKLAETQQMQPTSLLSYNNSASVLSSNISQKPLISAAAARVTGALRHSYPLGRGCPKKTPAKTGGKFRR